METGVFAPLRVADFRRLWLGQVVSVVGDKIHTIAMAMMVYSITGSMLQMGVMLGVTLLPAALFGLPAGVYVDRWDRRTTMIDRRHRPRRDRGAASRSSSATASGGRTGSRSSPRRCRSSSSRRSARSFPTSSATDQLMAANSLDNASEAIAEIVGLAIGAVIVAHASATRGRSRIDGITFLVSAGSIALIRYRKPSDLPSPPRSPTSSPRRSRAFAPSGRTTCCARCPACTSRARSFASASIAVCYALALERYDAGAPGPRDARRRERGRDARGRGAGGAHRSRRARARSSSRGWRCSGSSSRSSRSRSSIWTAMVLLAATGIANMFFFIPATTLFQTRSDASGARPRHGRQHHRDPHRDGARHRRWPARSPTRCRSTPSSWSSASRRFMAAGLGWTSVALREA